MLLAKTEPETGTTQYSYYSGGLLQNKLDAKSQQTQYSYDSYARLTQIRHYPANSNTEDVCQQVNFYYDSNPFAPGYSQYALGRQTAVSYRGAGCGNITPGTGPPVNPNTFIEMYSYTQAGQKSGNELLVSQYISSDSTTVTADLEATYSYDNEGRMTGLRYPSSAASGFSGDSYAYTFDSLGRPIALTDQTSSVAAVSGVTYGPAGEMLTIDYGMYSTVNESRTYNSLLQLTNIGAYNVNTGAQFGRQYSYSGTQNNGKIQWDKDTISGEQVSYQYDALNRLIAAQSGTWGQGFAYDGFGNLTDKNVISGSAPVYHTTFSAATNRDASVGYDTNGNQATAVIGGFNYSLGYDIENRLLSLAPSGYTAGAGALYGYGPGNQRVYFGNGN